MESLPHELESTMIEIPSPYINQDFLFDLCEQAGISSYGTSTSLTGEEFLQSLNFNEQHVQLNPELNPKLLWKRVICVIRVSRCFMIRKRVGSLERDRVNKKQKIS